VEALPEKEQSTLLIHTVDVIDLGRLVVGRQIQEIVNGHLAVLNVVQDAPAHLTADQEVATITVVVKGRVRQEDQAVLGTRAQPLRQPIPTAAPSTRTDRLQKTP